MIRSIRTFSLMLCIAVAFIACSDDKKRMEEPLDADPVDDDSVGADENAGSSEGSPTPSNAVPEEPTLDDAEDVEADESMEQDDAMSESEEVSPGAAPSEKGGIISSGVKKERKRCRLIADELERQKCLREQAK